MRVRTSEPDSIHEVVRLAHQFMNSSRPSSGREGFHHHFGQRRGEWRPHRRDHQKQDQAPTQSEGEPPKNTSVHGRERPTGSGSSGERTHSKQSGSSGSGVINKQQGNRNSGSKHSQGNRRKTYCIAVDVVTLVIYCLTVLVKLVLR